MALQKLHRLLYGCDYNPEQWLDLPEILQQDIVLMKEAGINCVSMGMFSWACLEPEEGVYQTAWLCDLVETLYQNGIFTILCTPSGARPVWMAHQYPEVLRVNDQLQRNQMGGRHNHCFTSPVYRQKVWQMNTVLAKALGNHPGVLSWHLSNEYSGACYCPLCQQAFREWLQQKYGTLGALNQAWWTTFWSHRYTSWEQIQPPLARGEREVQGLQLDWLRFVTAQTVNFCAWEKQAVREAGSPLPVTTNMMEFTFELDYAKFSDVLDYYSWDSYPEWHAPGKSVYDTAAQTSVFHDLMRSCKQQPFLLMESTPSNTTWRGVSKLKKPGVNQLAGLMAVAHGADSVQYFQWRKSRGACEKFHGAVVSHDGRRDTRVFSEVAVLGQKLETMGFVQGQMPRAEVAVLFDWENRWALRNSFGPRNEGIPYEETVSAHHKAFWKMGLPVDVIDSQRDFSGYKILCAPLLYLLKPGVAQRLKKYVEQGGLLVSGCFSGVVDENDLCFQGDTPFGLDDVFGLRTEEIDALYSEEENTTLFEGMESSLKFLCERVHLQGAKALAVYQKDFYAGEPVVCENQFGAGKAYYLASLPDQALLDRLYQSLCRQAGLCPPFEANLPPGVAVTVREGKNSLIFVQNCNETEVHLPLEKTWQDAQSGELYHSVLPLAAYGTVLVRPR